MNTLLRTLYLLYLPHLLLSDFRALDFQITFGLQNSETLKGLPSGSPPEKEFGGLPDSCCFSS
jgi:hypothetical protein